MVSSDFQLNVIVTVVIILVLIYMSFSSLQIVCIASFIFVVSNYMIKSSVSGGGFMENWFQTVKNGIGSVVDGTLDMSAGLVRAVANGTGGILSGTGNLLVSGLEGALKLLG